MAEVTDFLVFIVQQILLQGPLFLGLVAALGAILARKRPLEVLETFTKAAAGIAVISAGSGVLVGAFKPLGDLMVKVFGFEGLIIWNIPSWNYALTLAPPSYHINVPLAGMMTLALAFVLNLIAARLTPIKTVYLTPHFMNFIAVANTVAVSWYFPEADLLTVVLIAAVAAFLMEWLVPEIARRLSTKYWIPEGAYTVGHATELFGAVYGRVAQSLGMKPEESAEKVKVPDELKAIADYVVMSLIISLGMFIPIVLAAGPELTPSGGMNYILYAVVQAISFTAGVVVLITGVRLFIGAMMPAFKGISERLIPGAIPAYDAPVIFPLGPRAMLIGAATTLVTAPLITIIMGLSGFPVVPVPVAISIFFHGSTWGIFGDKMAGWKGAIFTAALGMATEMLLASLVVYPLVGPLFGKGFTWMGDNNVFYALWFGLLKLITGR
ncbi:MAG: hypothetical protein OEZ25_01500 [Candidatus Bathyarchaeota archaeon]|nr:hypothetical protein [Candidatus Bathyarchaeota archaeon]